MKWEKKGLIYCPDGKSDWAKNTIMTPTPFLLNEDTIRIYCGFRDGEGVSRIGYIDLSAENPTKVIKVSQRPVLDIGKDGCFDDNGVILGDVIRNGDEIWMYYIGFQLVKKAKFLAFTGLAISKDGGETFTRFSNAPVFDRGANSTYFRAIHSIANEDGKFRVWHALGDQWKYIDGKPYPQYNIWYTESRDGINFDNNAKLCIETIVGEYRIGRPRVYKRNGLYQMFYTRDFIDRNYILGYAESKDGIAWTRKDDEVGIEKSSEGWDSEMLCYPTILEYKSKTYMFYCGNEYGKTGFGYAVLV